MVSTIIAYGIMYGGMSLATATFVATFAVNFALSYVVTRLFSDNPERQQDMGVRQQVPPSAVNAIPVVYGTAYMGGTFVDAVLTTDQKTMYYVLAISSISPDGQFVFDTTDMYYGDRKITFDGTDQTKVISLTDEASPPNVDDKISGNLYISLYKSDAAGTITPLNGAAAPSTVMGGSDIAAALRWTGTRQMNSLGFAIVKLVYNRDANTTQLSPITFKVSHTLRGTGVAKPGDVWYDYITNTVYGGAVNPSFVDSASRTTLNTYSDALITFNNSSGVPSTQARYRINGVLDAGQSVLSNIDRIMSACDSWMTYNAALGQWSVVVNKAEGAAYAFTDSNIIGEIRVSATDITSSINQVEARFPFKDNRDQAAFVNIQTPSGLLYPNEPVNKYSITYDLVNDSVQAHYLANRLLEQAREDLIVNFNTTYFGIQVDAGDVVSVTNSDYGWNAKLFRVIKVNEASLADGSLGARLEMSEYNAQVYDDQTINQFSPVPNSGLPNVGYFSALAAPTVLASRPSAQIPSFDVRVTIPATGRVTSITLYYTTSATPTNNDWVLLSLATQSNSLPYTNGASFDFLNQVLPTGTYYFGFIVSNDVGQSIISPVSSSFAWAPITTGSRNAYPTLYQWAATQPANPTGSSTFTWNTGVQVYTDVDAWRVVAPANPGTAGFQLWEAFKWLNDTTGAATTTFNWTVGGTQVQSISQNGTAGSTGPRSASGFVYYAFASGSAPSSPTASGFDFTTGAFTTLTANWSTSFSMPSTNILDTNNNKFWAARYAVSEATFGGAQTVTISSVFNWTNFDGLVTFTNMSSPSGTNPSGGITFIDGGHIIAETLTVDKIESGTSTTQSGNTFGFGLGTSVYGISTAGFFKSTNSGTAGLAGIATNSVGIAANTASTSSYGALISNTYGFDSINSIYVVTGVTAAGPNFGLFTQRKSAQGASTSEGAPGTNTAAYSYLAYLSGSDHYGGRLFTTNTSGVDVRGIVAGGPTYGLTVVGGTAPFTGCHDGLLPKGTTVVAGDIIVDTGVVVATSGVTDTITEVAVSSTANQKGALGIFAAISEQTPNILQIAVITPVWEHGEWVDTVTYELNPIYQPIVDTHDYVAINSIGEGQINVCGEGGDFQVGDLIVCSSTAGKGMKQSDDIVRNTTVAKVREAVTFASPTEVKLVSCIYLCG
jgi:hypothetical protein